MNSKSSDRLLKTGIIGAFVAALCCFTPLLVVLLGAAGLGALTGYLDVILLPAMIIFLIIGTYGFYKKQQGGDKCCVPQKKRVDKQADRPGGE